MIFIDGANIFNSIREINEKIREENEKLPPEQKVGEINIDYNKLINELSNNREVIRAYFFDGDRVPSTREGFFNSLRQSGINVVTRPLRGRELNCLKCNLFKSIKEQKKFESKGTEIIQPFNKSNNGKVLIFRQEYQKGVDVALVTELLRMAREGVYDTAIVISGDNDYKNAIECTKLWGKRVEVASFRKALGADLKQVADRLIFLDNILDKIKRQIKSGKISP